MADQCCVNKLKALCELRIGEMVKKTSLVKESVAKLNVVGKCNVMGYGNYNKKDTGVCFLDLITALYSIM